jgi:hypothetical protein
VNSERRGNPVRAEGQAASFSRQFDSPTFRGFVATVLDLGWLPAPPHSESNDAQNAADSNAMPEA